jgi:hypothetical protein
MTTMGKTWGIQHEEQQQHQQQCLSREQQRHIITMGEG